MYLKLTLGHRREYEIPQKTETLRSTSNLMNIRNKLKCADFNFGTA